MKNSPRYEKFPPCFSTSQILNNENPVLNYEKSPPLVVRHLETRGGGFFIEIALILLRRYQTNLHVTGTGVPGRAGGRPDSIGALFSTLNL